MQEKHFLFTHYYEDRDIFINKVKYSKTIFHIGDNPQPGDIIKDKKQDFHTFFAEWIIENYNDLPEYLVLCQSEPEDHVHEPLLAIDSTFNSDFGSLSYARSLYNQFATNWNGNLFLPLRDICHRFEHGFHNDNNSSKSLYLLYPGEVVFLSKKRILEKPKSFYQKLIDWDNCDNLFKFMKNLKIPYHVLENLNRNYPQYKNLSKKEKLEIMTSKIPNKTYGHFGLCLEALWLILFSSKETFKMLEKSQAVLGNKLYCKTQNTNYDSNFDFEIYPYSKDSGKTILNLKLLENDWFDFNCPYYLEWRKTLIEKTIWEGERRGFDGKKLLEFYNNIGYKHISL